MHHLFNFDFVRYDKRDLKGGHPYGGYPKRGEFFFVEENGQRLAEITFFKSGVHEITVDHTVVSDKLRGQKVGNALLEKVVAFAREENLKIVPVCSFVQQQFEKHAEYADVWAK